MHSIFTDVKVCVPRFSPAALNTHTRRVLYSVPRVQVKRGCCVVYFFTCVLFLHVEMSFRGERRRRRRSASEDDEHGEKVKHAHERTQQKTRLFKAERAAEQTCRNPLPLLLQKSARSTRQVYTGKRVRTRKGKKHEVSGQ